MVILRRNSRERLEPKFARRTRGILVAYAAFSMLFLLTAFLLVLVHFVGFVPDFTKLFIASLSTSAFALAFSFSILSVSNKFLPEGDSEKKFFQGVKVLAIVELALSILGAVLIVAIRLVSP